MVGSASHEIPYLLWDTKTVFKKKSCPKPDEPRWRYTFFLDHTASLGTELSSPSGVKRSNQKNLQTNQLRNITFHIFAMHCNIIQLGTIHALFHIRAQFCTLHCKLNCTCINECRI